MKELDLSWGNPRFLYPYWKNKGFLFYSSLAGTDYIYGGLESLKESILKLHRQEKNSNIKGKHIVIGNGATQVLTATIACLEKNSVFAGSPFFLRFPNISELAQTHWYNDPFEKEKIEIITNPNNPDGKVTNQSRHTSIYDLSYNWKQYGRQSFYNEDIMIYSLAKATGHASTRIGWGIFKSKELADKITKWIEINTAGVSVEAQCKAEGIINNQLEGYKTIFRYGQNILINRWNSILKLKVPFEIHSSNGMFLWIRMQNIKSYLSKKKIKYIEGSQFGSTDDYGRINIGCSEEEFNEFIKRIK